MLRDGREARPQRQSSLLASSRGSFRPIFRQHSLFHFDTAASATSTSALIWA